MAEYIGNKQVLREYIGNKPVLSSMYRAENLISGGLLRFLSGPGIKKVSLMGTSIAAGASSGHISFVKRLMAEYGDLGAYSQQAGVLGGNWNDAYKEWYKQPYGGMSFNRLRGSNASSAFSIYIYFDTLEIMWSREADCEPFSISIDDGAAVSVGSVGGTQRYSNLTTINATPGLHKVTFNPPSAGYSYIEGIYGYDSRRQGVLFLNGSLGGSSVKNMRDLRNAVATQVSGIAIEPNVGLDGYSTIDGVGLAIISHTVNDAGAGLVYISTDFQTMVRYMLANFKARGVKVMIIIEMGGHFAMPNDSNHAAFNAACDFYRSLHDGRDVFVYDWHAATIIDDLALYAATHYLATDIDVSTATYTGDFIHPGADGYSALCDLLRQKTGVDVFGPPNYERYRTHRTNAIDAPESGTVNVGGVSKTLMREDTPAVLMQTRDQYKIVNRYVDATAVNAASNVWGHITESGLSDEYGAYFVAANKTYEIPDDGDYTLTILASGDTKFLAPSSSAIMADGVEFERDGAYRNVAALYVEGGPVYVSVSCKRKVSSASIGIYGKIYGAWLIKADAAITI